MTSSGELTQRKFSELWVVEVGKKEYKLNEKQIALLKEADLAGQRGIVWFKDFAISIPHIQSIYLVERYLPEERAPVTYEEVKDEKGRISYRAVPVV